MLVASGVAAAMDLALMALPLLDADGFATIGSEWAWLDPAAIDNYLDFWEGWFVVGTLVGALVVLALSLGGRVSSRLVPAFRVAALVTAALTYAAILANFHKDMSRFFEEIGLGGVLLVALPLGLVICAAKAGNDECSRPYL